MSAGATRRLRKRGLPSAVAASGTRRRGERHAFNYALMDLLNLLALCALAPYWLYMALVRGKYREGLLQRFGWLPRGRIKSGCIWVHGVSVGEILAARHLIEELGHRHPDRSVVISTTTNTGQAIARREYPGHYVFYYPFDLSGVLRNVLSRLRPAVLVLLELEVWPTMLRLAEARGLPVVVVNGRLSPRSYRFYSRFGRFRMGFLNRVRCYGVQTEETAARMRRLGIRSDKVTVTGSLKYDTVPLALAEGAELARIRERLGITEGEQLLLLGSTHPSEAAPLAEVALRLLQGWPRLRIVWVPRHPERAGAIVEALRARGLPGILLSQRAAGSEVAGSSGVLIGDTMGELADFYQVASIVFIGKSLGRERGGQNMLEPAALGRPVAVGPNTQNFRTEVEFLVRRGALAVVEDVDDLVSTLELWLTNPVARCAVGAAAAAAVASLAGGTSRSLELIETVLS